MIHQILIEVTKYLQAFLSSYLPQINDNWWENCVIKELTFNQKQELERKKSKSLSSLDLAMLLKVFEIIIGSSKFFFEMMMPDWKDRKKKLERILS
jgi:hypothetical protein